MNAHDSARRPLPSGTVSLLFADVEGSTRLLNLLGQRFGPARARMRQLVREAASAHDGAEVDWAGDGVFLAFAGVRDDGSQPPRRSTGRSPPSRGRTKRRIACASGCTQVSRIWEPRDTWGSTS